MLAMAVAAVACTSGEDVVVEETTTDTTMVVEDTTLVTEVETEGELSSEVE